VLATTYPVHATSGNLNNLVGVPLTILAAPDDTEALVWKRASVPGEIPRLRDVIEPTIAVITNVGYAHVEGFGSLAGVMQEKVALVEGARMAVVGTDPPELASEARRRAPTVVAGTGAGAQVRPDAAELDDEGHPRITWRGHVVTLPVVGSTRSKTRCWRSRWGGRRRGPGARGRGPRRRAAPGRAGRGALARRPHRDRRHVQREPWLARWALKLAHWLAERRRRPLAVVVGSMLELGPESARLHAAAAADIAALQPALWRRGRVRAGVRAAPGGARKRLVTAPDADALGPRLKTALAGNEIVLLKASRGWRSSGCCRT